MIFRRSPEKVNWKCYVVHSLYPGSQLEINLYPSHTARTKYATMEQLIVQLIIFEGGFVLSPLKFEVVEIGVGRGPRTTTHFLRLSDNRREAGSKSAGTFNVFGRRSLRTM